MPSFCILKMNDTKLKLDKRLSAAASFVREGAVVADIGTDHAYLPVYLLLCGKCKSAVASDINKGPLDSAVANAEKYGVAEKTEFVLVGGISDEVCERNSVTDVVICGMGGELIAKIISDSEYAKKVGVRLVLQPMSFAPELREYLLSHGFCILDEMLCRAAGRVYTVICAEYDGEKREYSELELSLGKKNIEKRDELFRDYCKKTADKLRTQIKGKTSGGVDCTAEKRLLAEIEGLMEE